MQGRVACAGVVLEFRLEYALKLQRAREGERNGVGGAVGCDILGEFEYTHCGVPLVYWGEVGLE